MMKYRLYKREWSENVVKVAVLEKRDDAEKFLELLLETWLLEPGECYELVEVERDGTLRSLVSFNHLYRQVLLQDPVKYRDEEDLKEKLNEGKPPYQLKKMQQA